MKSMSRLLAVPLLLAALACGDSTNPGTQNTISVEDNTFNPNAMTVSVGQTVHWNWAGQNGHSVTFVDDPSGGSQPPGTSVKTSGTFDLTFNNAGTFDFYCTVHGTPTSGMRGQIIVQ